MRKRFIGTILMAAIAATLVPLAAGTAGASTVGTGQGCTPGYWKNHPQSWEEYTPSMLLGNQFQIPAQLASYRTWTFMQALQGGGGTGLDGAAQILFRASIASFLNAAHDSISYPLQRDHGTPTLRQRINSALASLNRDTMLSLASYLDGLNNAGCPLS
jgi:hypothetical protein